MNEFLGHFDRAAWLSRPNTLEADVAHLAKLTGAALTRFDRPDVAFPRASRRKPASKSSRRWNGRRFSTQGCRASLRRGAKASPPWSSARPVGALMDDHPGSPWHGKLVLWERTAGEVMNTNFVPGDIDYADEVIPIGDAGREG